jgi:dienelactone hydrolase
MTPMLRAENGNPGNFELLLGEVEDAAAAVRWLASRPDVNSERIYAFGHSVGGGVAALLSLRAGLPLRHTGSAGGLYAASVFDDWRDIVPFDPQRAGERELRLLLGNLRWMRHPHIAFLGASDTLLLSREIALRELGGTKTQLRIEVVPGDHFSSLPAAVKAYLRVIERSSP